MGGQNKQELEIFVNFNKQGGGGQNKQQGSELGQKKFVNIGNEWKKRLDIEAQS